jgi:hypothetical protein
MVLISLPDAYLGSCMGMHFRASSELLSDHKILGPFEASDKEGRTLPLRTSVMSTK